MQTPEIPKSARLEIYSHHVVVSHFNVRVKAALVEYCKTMGQWGLVRVARGKFQRQIVRIFAAANNQRTEYRFHIYQKDDLLQHLSNYGILPSMIEVVEHEMYEPVKVEYVIKDARVARDYQIPLIDYNVAEGKSKVTTLQTGKGKAQWIGSSIKVPGGWKKMGDMKVGDQVVCPDGSVSNVIGVYPQGMREMFEVTFYDGRKTIVDAEHLWKVYYVNTSENSRWRIVDTMEMLRLHSMPNPRVYIPLIQPCAEEGEVDKELTIDPYLLGLLLGDGGFSAGTAVYTSADQFLIDQVASLIPSEIKMKSVGKYGYAISGVKGRPNPLVGKLRELGLAGKRSWEKEIPTEYLTGSRNQRLALVQGLLDTDGYVDRNTGSIVYYTTSIEMASHMQYLIRSLGGIATLGEKKPHFSHRGEKRIGRMCYCIYIRHQRPSELFRLPRKKEITRDDAQYVSNLKLHVESIEPVGKMEAQCIAIDHPDKLYVTDQFIVTHNTFIFLQALARIGERALIVIKPMYIQKWVDDIRASYDIETEDLIVVQGSAAFKALFGMAAAGTMTSKIIIVSNATYREYIKSYEEFGDNDVGYHYAPVDAMRALGVGVRFIDEVHQDYHMNFRLDLYTHVPKTISLSATLESDDSFMNRMYRINWPPHLRAPEVEFDRYIVMSNLWYNIDPRIVGQLRMTSANKQYSHLEFEKSILRKPVLLRQYIDMIRNIVRTSYAMTCQPGQKMLIFCSTIKMCTVLVEALKRDYPELLVNRYTADDSYEEFIASDIAVSTLKSAGTAIDIPNLYKCLMTTALSGKQANEQAVGRLRHLKDFPDVTPEFLYLSCRQIPKHIQYAGQKETKLNGKVLSFKEYNTSFYLNG